MEKNKQSEEEDFTLLWESKQLLSVQISKCLTFMASYLEAAGPAV